MEAYFNMLNISAVMDKIFKSDNFDPIRARQVMKVICESYFATNGVEIDPSEYHHYCNATFDSFSCWPATYAGLTAEISCPSLRITDNTRNATRLCRDNGTWDMVDYNTCMINKSHDEDTQAENIPSLLVIYNVGCAIATVALFIALAIFVYFKSLRCIRNSIHCHLIVAYIVNNVSWVILYNTLFEVYHHPHGWVCRLVVMAFNYCLSVPFFWMFAEGLYLYTVVVWAYTTQKIRMWYFVIIGWGTPLVVAIVWAIVKLHYEDVNCWLPSPRKNYYDYIIFAPILLILLCNVIFIVDIVWVLVTKLKASNTLETRRSRKAVRATFVLLPLLGLTFILFLKPPIDNPVLEKVFSYVNGFMHSLQGILVATIYCFTNGEVKTVIRKKLHSIQDSRNLTRYTKSSIFSSPHRSSGYAMHQLSTAQQGKNSHGMKRASNESGNTKLYLTDDPDTEACTTSMVENMDTMVEETIS